MDSIEATIHYKFTNPLLLAEALTHPSLARESHRTRFDNQRLEHLGDAVIQLILTEELFRLFPEAGEGPLTKMRSRLVSRAALMQFALKISLGRHLLLGRGEIIDGGRERPSNLADAFEALVGAIYLDGGLDASRAFLFDNFREFIEEIVAAPEEKNPKGALQECLQAIAPSSPTYHLIGEEGPEHRKSFRAEVRWEDLVLGRGSGRSKQEAEISAATEALEERRWEGGKSL